MKDREGKSMFGGSKQRQQLFRLENLHTVIFAVQALYKSMINPYILKKLRMCLKPIALAAGAVYLAGMLLLVPFTIIAFLVSIVSLGYLDNRWLMQMGKSWVKESVALVPFLAILTMKTFIRRPLHRCFVHTLGEINPAEAARLEANDPSSKSMSDYEAPRTQGRRALRIVQKAAFLLMADAVLHHAQKGHVIGSVAIGRALVAASHFYTMKKVLGRDRAIVLALLGVIPYLEPWVLKFVQVWRASNLLGQELLSDYLQYCVPSNGRAAFLKSHDVDIPLFAMPGSLLLLVPFLGPLFFVPLQASIAYLVDKFDKEEKQVHSNGGYTYPVKKKGPELAPTLPAGIKPFS